MMSTKHGTAAPIPRPLLFFPMIILSAVLGVPRGDAQPTDPAWRSPDSIVRAFHTGARLQAAPSRAQWDGREHWAQPTAPAQPEGGWVLANDRFLVSVQPGAESIDAIAFDADGLWEPVFSLSPNTGAFRGRITQIRLESATPQEEATLLIRWSDEDASERTLRVSVPFDLPSLAIRAQGQAFPVGIEAASTHIVAGDMRGYDALVSASVTEEGALNFPVGSRAFPSVTQALKSRNALLVTTLPAPGDLLIRRGTGPDGQAVFDETRIWLGADSPVWLSTPAAPGIWAEGDASDLSRTRDMPLDWSPPFPAQWRLILPYAGGLYAGNSIHFEAQYPLPDGRAFITETGFLVENPRRWSSTRGYYIIPLQITESEVLLRTPRFARGPANGAVHESFLLYPQDRNPSRRGLAHLATPVRPVTVMDVVQAALGEARMAEYAQGRRMNPYRSTCDTTALIEKNVTQGEEFENEQELRERGATLGPFIALHRGRIEEYLRWTEAYEAFCRSRMAQHPGNEALRNAADQLRAVTDVIPGWYQDQKDRMGNVELTEEQARIMVNAALSRDPNKKEIVDAAGRQIRIYGGAHDHGLSEYRAVLQRFRQQALRLHLTERDPEVRRFLRDSLEFSEDLLKPFWRYENRA